MKKSRIQNSFLVELKKIPIVQVCCEKLDVSRNSVYRWRKEDEDFAKAMDEALAEGEKLVNDMTESQLLSLIGEKHWPAISFWLRHRNAKFRDRLEVTAKIENKDKPLTLEQEEDIKVAMQLGLPQKSYGS